MTLTQPDHLKNHGNSPEIGTVGVELMMLPLKQ